MGIQILKNWILVSLIGVTLSNAAIAGGGDHPAETPPKDGSPLQDLLRRDDKNDVIKIISDFSNLQSVARLERTNKQCHQELENYWKAKAPKSYSINLMWINKSLSPDQEFLATAKQLAHGREKIAKETETDEEAMKEALLGPALKWAIANPEAEVSLWYDSVHATKDQVENTQNILKKQLEEKEIEEKKEIKNVTLRDVREIPIVKANPDAFSDFPDIYYRIDMLKLIILVHSIENEKKDAAVFSDLQVGDKRSKHDRMSKNELFGKSTLKDLKAVGLIHNHEENQFLQLSNDPRMISAIKHAVINANLFRAETALNHPDKETRESLVPMLGEPLHKDTIRQVYKYYASTGPGKLLKVRPDIVDKGTKDAPWLEYHPEEHGYLPLGNAYSRRMREPYILKSPLYSKNFDGLLLNEVIDFADSDDLDWNNSRDVDVRVGNGHHFTWPDLIPRPPTDGERYRIQYWK
jgi:hypothetical protein